MKLRNKVALITGGSSGIGLAAAKVMSSEGAQVLIVGRNTKSLALAAKEASAEAIRADVSQLDDIDNLIIEIKQKNLKIDVLFINAGVSHSPSILDVTESDYNSLMDINLKGAFFTFTKALPILSEGASVIFTSSVAHDRGRPGDPLYSASKAAVRSLVRTLAADELVLAKKIRVNAVSPGAITTPLTLQATPEENAAVDRYIESIVPMGRWGKSEEVAQAVLFLASSDSSYMTGAEIAVDGGLAQI